MVKTYFKTVRRMFRHHLIRLFSLIGIILISVGFISGIGSPTDMIRDSMENYYRNQNVSDFIVKSKTGSFQVTLWRKAREHRDVTGYSDRRKALPAPVLSGF